MAQIQGTHDDATPEEIKRIVENIVAQYQWRKLTEKIADVEFTLTVAEALENDELLD